MSNSNATCSRLQWKSVQSLLKPDGCCLSVDLEKFVNGAGQVGDESRGNFEEAGIDDGRHKFESVIVEQAQHKVLPMLLESVPILIWASLITVCRNLTTVAFASE